MFNSQTIRDSSSTEAPFPPSSHTRRANGSHAPDWPQRGPNRNPAMTPHPQPPPQPAPRPAPRPRPGVTGACPGSRRPPRLPAGRRDQANRAIRPIPRDPAPHVWRRPPVRLSPSASAFFSVLSSASCPVVVNKAQPRPVGRPGARPSPLRTRRRGGSPARARASAGQRMLARTSNRAHLGEQFNASAYLLPAPGRSHTRAPAGARNTAEFIALILDTETVPPAPRNRGFRTIGRLARRKARRN